MLEKSANASILFKSEIYFFKKIHKKSVNIDFQGNIYSMNNFNEPIDLRRLTLKNGLSYPNDKELIMLVLGSGTKKMPIEYMSEEILKVICSHNPENWLEKLQIGRAHV